MPASCRFPPPSRKIRMSSERSQGPPIVVKQSKKSHFHRSDIIKGSCRVQLYRAEGNARRCHMLTLCKSTVLVCGVLAGSPSRQVRIRVLHPYRSLPPDGSPNRHFPLCSRDVSVGRDSSRDRSRAEPAYVRVPPAPGSKSTRRGFKGRRQVRGIITTSGPGRWSTNIGCRPAFITLAFFRARRERVNAGRHFDILKTGISRRRYVEQERVCCGGLSRKIFYFQPADHRNQIMKFG